MQATGNIAPLHVTPILEIRDKILSDQNIRLFVKREDMIHPTIPGNKWRKLHYNIRHALTHGQDTLLTYGGAFSNHIAATATAAQLYGLKSIGMIRGDELSETSNPTLTSAHQNGMKLVFVSRDEFSHYKKTLSAPFPIDKNTLVLPEGGTNDLAIRGCEEIANGIPDHFDIIVCPVGTGGTCAGLIKGMSGRGMVWGFSALSGQWIHEEFRQLLATYRIKYENFKIFEDHPFGGYGKFNHDLIQFILDFKQKNDILLDPIYTGKMFFSVWELVKNAQIASNSRILLVHTGGLQGIKGFNQRYNLELPTA